MKKPNDTFLNMMLVFGLLFIFAGFLFHVDLVRWMIELAAGICPFTIGEKFTPQGHAMEFRVYAEDPGKNYQPPNLFVELIQIVPYSSYLLQ